MRKRIPIGAPGYVGGSMTAEALGLSTFGTPYTAWLKFTGKAPEPDERTKRIFQAGHRGEEMVSKLIEDFYGVKLRKEPCAYVDTGHPWLICHPDRIAETDDGPVPVEIKMASSFSSRKWGAEDTDEIPYQYLIQCYQYFRTGVPNPGYMWQFTFADNQLRRYIIPRNREIEDQVYARLIDLVENRWMNGEMPEPSTAEEAMRIWPMKDDDAVVASEETLDMVRELRAISAERKSLDERADGLKRDIIAFMQGHRHLMAGGERIATYSLSHGKRLDTKALKAECPDIYERFAIETESASLRV